MIGAVNTARGLAFVALILVFIAGVVNSVATSVQSQDNCRDIQQINTRLSDVFKQTREELKSGARDDDIKLLYGNDPKKLPNGKTVPHWQYVKITTINQYDKLIHQFREQSCPYPILGINHRKMS